MNLMNPKDVPFINNNTSTVMSVLVVMTLLIGIGIGHFWGYSEGVIDKHFYHENPSQPPVLIPKQQMEISPKIKLQPFLPKPDPSGYIVL